MNSKTADFLGLLLLIFCGFTVFVTTVTCAIGFPILLFTNQHYIIGILTLLGEGVTGIVALVCLFAYVNK